MFSQASLPPVLADRETAETKGEAYRYLQKEERVAVPKLDEQMSRYRTNYYGMLRLIDDQVARLFDHLEATGKLENTLFIGVSDHGDYVGDFGLMRKGAGVSESLIRIPFLVSGPGVSKAGRSDAHVSLIDVLPTICDMIGAKIPAGTQGRSLWPLLRGEPYPAEEFRSILIEQGFGGTCWDNEDSTNPESWMHKNPNITFHELGPYTQSGTTRVLCRDDWKLVLHGTGQGELYNLAEDPAEIQNLFHEPAHASIKGELAVDMAQRLTQFQPVNPMPGEEMHIKVPHHNWWRNC
jgi:arylsulfatase A-like enzyme